MQLKKLQKTIGYSFKNVDLLVESLTHPSLAHEEGSKTKLHNQRLEFLGDAILQLVLTDRIYRENPDLQEGKLTQIRAHLANRHTLHRRARAIGLGKYLLLGRGEDATGGRERLSNLANTYEALIGAVYLDRGLRATKKFVLDHFAEEFANVKQKKYRQNPKGHLQEILQTRSKSSPVYRVIRESGPDHSKHFEITVEWHGKEIGRGQGSSKKRAETNAAESALAKLTKQASQPG